VALGVNTSTATPDTACRPLSLRRGGKAGNGGRAATAVEFFPSMLLGILEAGTIDPSDFISKQFIGLVRSGNYISLWVQTPYQIATVWNVSL